MGREAGRTRLHRLRGESTHARWRRGPPAKLSPTLMMLTLPSAASLIVSFLSLSPLSEAECEKNGAEWPLLAKSKPPASRSRVSPPTCARDTRSLSLSAGEAATSVNAHAKEGEESYLFELLSLGATAFSPGEKMVISQFVAAPSLPASERASERVTSHPPRLRDQHEDDLLPPPLAPVFPPLGSRRGDKVQTSWRRRTSPPERGRGGIFFAHTPHPREWQLIARRNDARSSARTRNAAAAEDMFLPRQGVVLGTCYERR